MRQQLAEVCLTGFCVKLSTGMQIPDGTILSPADDAAVVGGNVLTSQRVTDVILYAFQAMACSYGCVNNFTFGDATLGYYETIAGGGGGGPGFHGCDGVQMHICLLYTSPSPRDRQKSRMPSSA